MQVQVGIKVNTEPDFYPDHLDVDVPPPAGTIVQIGDRTFIVDTLTLHARVRVDGGRGYRTHYEATLRQ